MQGSYRNRRLSARKRLRSTNPADRRLAAEQLEHRRMLSVSATSYRYTIDGTGGNPNESILTPANVLSTANGGTFGERFSVSVDGQVLAQPLYMTGLTITAPGSSGTQNIVFTAPNTQNTVHNVVFVATENDSLYAIDATTGQKLWQDSFINGTTIITVPSGDVSSGDISPQIGITGTPAIDPATGFLYVVAKTKQFEHGDTTDPHYVNTLYKVDIQNGTDSSVVIADTTDVGGAYTYNSGPYVLGTGDGAITVNGQSRVYFNSLRQMFRPGVLLYNGQIILGSASHGDNDPYHGWMLTYNASTLALTGVLNTTPNGGLGGIWQGDGAIVVDPQGNFYFETGNGSFNQNPSNFPGGNTSLLPIDADYGDSFVKVAIDTTTTQSNQNANGWGLKVVDYFTPQDQAKLNSGDEDLGSGGPIILPASAGSAEFPDLMLGGGKEGEIYLINRDHMGGFSTTDAGVVQEQTQAVGGILSVPAYFNGDIYYTGGYSGGINEFSIVNGTLSTNTISTTPDGFGNLDGGPIVTSDGSVNGIVWALDRGSGQLRAYSAANLRTELYTSAQAANNADQLGSVMKYTTPMVANGRVFVGTSDALVVYGLPTQPTQPPTAPTNLTLIAPAATEVSLSWTDVAFDAAAYDIERSADNGVTWTQIGQAAANATSYNDTTAQPLTQYSYRVRGTNSVGNSGYTNVATITTPGAQVIGTGDGLVGQYYPGININFANSTPTLTRVDPSINFNWTNAGPVAALGNTDYSVRWTGEVQAQYSEFYTFTTNSDDGIRVIIHGQTVINDYADHTATVDTSVPIQFTAGESATIEVDYFQDTGPAKAELEWSSQSTPLEVIPQSQLFSGSAPAVPVLATPVAASGTQLNLSWTEGSNFENGYEIDRKIGASGTYSTLAIVNPSVTTYMDTGLSQDTIYYYKIRALNFGTDSAFSNEVNLLTPEPPITPSGAQPTSITTTQIAMSWVNNADNGITTRISRNSGPGGNFIFVAALPASTTSYVDNGPGGQGLTPGTQYDYHIQVGNQAGYSDFTGFVVQTLTTAPTELIAVGGDSQVTLAWNVPTGAQTFNIYRSTSAGGEGAVPVATGVSGDTFIDTGLTNGQTYYYEVSSVDTGGESALSAEASVTPLAPTSKSSPPTAVTATAGDTSAALHWIAAEGAASYTVYRGTSSGHETFLQSGITTTSFADTGLINGTTYYYVVTSVNSHGEGTASSEVVVSPHTLPPPTPIDVMATGGNSQVGLSWTAASDASSYNIYRATDSGDEVLYQQGVIGTSFNDTGVTNGVTYYYQVSAANGVGESNLSLEVSATPLPPLPTAPASLTATALNFAQIKLQWQESSLSLTGFQILRSTNGVTFSPLTTLDPSATSYVDSSNLVVGTTYYYQVLAMNSAGSSNASNTAHSIVQGQIPPGFADADIGGPAFAGSASYSSGVMTVAGGGSDIWYSADQFNYLYQSLNGNGTIIAQVLTQGNTNPWAMAGVMIRNSISDPGSTYADMVITPGNGAAFQYRATAHTSNLGNDQAGGAVTDWVKLTRTGSTITGYVSTDGVTWSEAGSYTFAAGTMNTQVYIGLAVTAFNNKQISTATFGNVSISGQMVPTTPTNFTATPASGTSNLLHWQDTDASIFSYNVFRQNPITSTYALIATVPGSVTSFLDTGLSNGATESYQVVATNTSGQSSAASVSDTLPVVPQAPSVLQPNQVSANSAGLSWVLNSSNDTAVDVYQRAGNATNFTLVATLAAGSTAYEATGLQTGTVYEYQVSAVNLAGQSDFADTGFTTLPAAPANFTATAGSNGITLQWQAATGALIYNVYRGLSASAEGASPYASGLTSPTFVDDGVNAGTTYYYTVTAADFSGESAHSAEAIAGAEGSPGVSLLVSGTQVAGALNGTDNIVIAAGSDVTVTSIVENSVVIGDGATLTIAPSGPAIASSTIAAASSAMSAADSSGSAVLQAALARVAAVRAKRLAAQAAAASLSTDAVVSSTAVAAPVAISTSASADVADVTTAPVIQPAVDVVSQAPVENVTPAVVTSIVSPIVASTNLQSATPMAPPSPSASPATTPPAALPTILPASSVVATEVVLPPATIQVASPKSTVETVKSESSQTEFGAAIPVSFQILAGQGVDRLGNSLGTSSSSSSQGVLNATAMAIVSQFSTIAPLGSDAADLLEFAKSANTGDSSSIQEAIDAVLADGGSVASRLDDALLSLLAGNDL